MSGPKVVRIVTREEIEAICRGHLRAVSNAADGVLRFARRHDRLTAALEQEIAARRAAFEKLFRDEKWMDIQKLGPQVELFLKKEVERLETVVITEAAAARCGRRQAADAARSLAASLTAAGAPVSAELAAAAAGSVSDVSQARAIVEQALRTMRTAIAASAASEASQQLAQRLSVGDAPTSIEAWLSQQPASQDPAIAKVDAALAELETIAGAEAAAAFAARADAVAAEAERGRRALLADSLILEAAAVAAEHRARIKERSRIAIACAGLDAVASQHAARYRGQLSQLKQDAKAKALHDLAAGAEAELAAATAEQTAIARRRALLTGLSELGYEVRQSMTTALAEQGRVVVRKPSDADYGVEISNPPGAERLQIRLVGAAQPTSPRNAGRDRDKEVSWCGDVSRLRTLIGSAGREFIVERAVGAGAELVKTVKFAHEGNPAEYVAENSLRSTK